MYSFNVITNAVGLVTYTLNCVCEYTASSARGPREKIIPKLNWAWRHRSAMTSECWLYGIPLHQETEINRLHAYIIAYPRQITIISFYWSKKIPQLKSFPEELTARLLRKIEGYNITCWTRRSWFGWLFFFSSCETHIMNPWSTQKWDKQYKNPIRSEKKTEY